MNKYALIILLLLPIFAYNQSKVWYFGYNSGIDFNSGTAVAITNGNMTSIDGCATITDSNGNLMFYTDGKTLWDKSMSITSNGSNLLGAASSCQSAVFIPMPCDKNKMVLATIDMIENKGNNGLRYNIIDLTLNGGKGDIISGKKNILLTQPACEKVISIPHSNGTDIWLITYKANTDSILSYLITSTGVNPVPIRSNTGYVIDGDLNKTLGYMKVSRNFKKIVSAHYLESKILLMDFDNTTGMVSNILKWDVTSPDGVEFSPNDSLLYVAGFRGPAALYQYDITSNNATIIKGSENTIYTFSGYDIGALQAGPDKKIYLAKNNQPYLGVINKPNVYGNGCNFSSDGLNLKGRNSAYGLPNIYYSYPHISSHKIIIKDTCYLSSSFFSLSPYNNLGYIEWDFGDPASGANNIAKGTGTNFKHTYANPGKYRVTAYYQQNCLIDTSYRDIWIINNAQTFSIGKDTAVCSNTNLTITPNTNGLEYLWSTGATTKSILTDSIGVYWLEIKFPCGISRDTILVTPKTKASKIFAGNDTIVCDKPFSLSLSVSCIDPHTTLWSNGASTDNTTVVDSGYYFVTVKNVCHTFKDTIRIELFNKYLNLGRDTALCFAADFIISVPNRTNYQYKWQDGSTGNTFAAKRKGQYYLTTSYGKCQASDTLNISGDDATDELYIPNAFSPNDDEVNDLFPFTFSSKPIDIEIYNRWGEKIYDAKKSQIGWNGVYKNNMVESGVYLYKIKYKDCSNRNVFVKGTFTVIY